MKIIIICIFCFSLIHFNYAEEQQSHGLDFERKVIDQMLGRTYTEDWDIPAAANRIHPNTPASIKFIKWGNAIYMGDALRQISITKPFEMIVGFYDIAPSQEALQVLAVHSILVSPEKWRVLWGSVTPQDIQKLHRVAGDGMDSLQARKLAPDVDPARLVLSFPGSKAFFFDQSTHPFDWRPGVC